jgi:hypothetical protein
MGRELASEQQTEEMAMAKHGQGLLAVWTDIPAAMEGEFNRWYNEEHLAERVGIPGFLNARRYVSLEGTPKYIALYETADARVLRSETYLKVLNNASPWTQSIRPHFQRFVRNEYEWILSLGTLPDRAAPYVLTVRLETDPEHEAEFNEWYNTDHLPALVSVPGVYAARRYRTTAGSPKYLAVYELASRDVPQSEAWKKAAESPWTQSMRPRFKGLAANLGQLLVAMP